MGLDPELDIDESVVRHEALNERLDAAIDSLGKLLDGRNASEVPELPELPELAALADFAGYSNRYTQKLALVRALVDMQDPVLVPELDPFAPLGHSCADIEASLSLDRGGGLNTLEELADLGILRREFLNRVNLCPKCARCQVNFRETCPVCESVDLDVERTLVHFACAYSGLESDFEQGLELVCPKCRVTLEQIGQDFERPGDAYTCRDSRHVFEEPEIQGQCLHCAHLFPGTDIEVARVYQYRPTLLAIRAVELNRLTGLDANEIMYDAKLKLAAREFLFIELQRELYRISRYGGSFVTASLHFEVSGSPVSIFNELSGRSVQELANQLVAALRNLDLVARMGGSRLGLLLIETDVAGANVVWERFSELLSAIDLTTRTGREIVPVWRAECWSNGKTSPEEVMAFFGDDVDET